MKKRTVFFVVVLALLCALFAGTAMAETKVVASNTEVRPEGSFLWQVERDMESGYKTLHLSGTGKMADYEAPGVFCEADRHPGYWTLSDHRMISRLIMDPGVTYIGANTFRGSVGSYNGSGQKHGSVMLSGTVTIPDTVTGIGDYAFADNNSLGKIEVPGSVVRIGRNAFHPSTVIVCPVDSFAHQYAAENGYSYELTGLAAPKLTGKIGSGGAVSLSWTELPYGDVTYNVYKVKAEYDVWRIYRGTGTSCTDTIEPVGRSYQYYVTATVGLGESPKSNTVKLTRKLTAPTVKAASLADTGRTKLTWAAIDGAESYDIYRCKTKTGTYTRIKKGVTKLYYTDTGAKAGVSYYYKVKAICSNTAANSAYSKAVLRTRDLAKPVLKLTLTSSSKLKLTWEKVTAAKQYAIYRCTTKTGTYKKIATTTKLTYTDKNVKKGKTYYYKLKALAEKSAANSAYSAIKYKKVK